MAAFLLPIKQKLRGGFYPPRRGLSESAAGGVLQAGEDADDPRLVQGGEA